MNEAGNSDKQVQPDYSKVMGLYDKLKDLKLKDEADKIMASISNKYTKNHPAPPEEIERGLEKVLANHGGHDKIPHSDKFMPLIDLGVITASLCLTAVAGPIAGIGAFGLYIASKNYASQPKTQHSH
jgi:hypothetical protein